MDWRLVTTSKCDEKNHRQRARKQSRAATVRSTDAVGCVPAHFTVLRIHAICMFCHRVFCSRVCILSSQLIQYIIYIFSYSFCRSVRYSTGCSQLRCAAVIINLYCKSLAFPFKSSGPNTKKKRENDWFTETETNETKKLPSTKRAKHTKTKTKRTRHESTEEPHWIL